MTEMWHFVADGKLRDGSAPALPGGVERWDGPIIPCESGLHASPRALDALFYAPEGQTMQVRLVRLGGEVVVEGERAAASERHIIASADCTRTLYEYALSCAESVRHLMTDPRSLAALDVERRWLDSEATDAELAAAANDASDALVTISRRHLGTGSDISIAAACVPAVLAAAAARSVVWHPPRLAVVIAASQASAVDERQMAAEIEQRLRACLAAAHGGAR